MVVFFEHMQKSSFTLIARLAAIVLHKTSVINAPFYHHLWMEDRSVLVDVFYVVIINIRKNLHLMTINILKFDNESQPI